MNRLMMIAGMVIAQLSQVAFFTAPAFASRGEGVNLATIRHQSSNYLKLVRIEGALSCEVAASSSGETCQLKIQDAKTGFTYSLNEPGNAMRLFEAGNKKVAIEGTMSGSEAIQVRKAEVL